MKQQSIEDLSLVVRALHRDVTVLDERLRDLESIVESLRAAQPESFDLAIVEASIRT
jgi:hypothetical protein